jgi:copper chaperone
MQEHEITIDGMSCQHCIMAVRRALSELAGVEVREVKIGSARITLDEAIIPLAKITEAIREAGYTAHM